MLRKVIRIVFILVILLVGVASLIYIFLSRNNPYTLQLILGSILLSLLLGVISTLVQGFMEKKFKNPPYALFLIAVSLLLMIVALLIQLSNTPQGFKKEIIVTYFIDHRTRDLLSKPLGDSETGRTCYLQAKQYFHHFMEKSPKAAKAVESAITHQSLGDDPVFLIKIFENFTEYLIADDIGYFFSTSDMEKLLYSGESRSWLGLPHPDIEGKTQTVNDIEGPFSENLFFGSERMDTSTKMEFRVPKDTSICLHKKDGVLSSQFTIKNKFLQIDITVAFLAGSSGGYAFLSEPEMENPYRPLLKFETRIFYDVKYSKWRYSYPEMQHYEKWSQDLFLGLQRKFSWGNPPLAEFEEVMRYFKQLEKS